MNTPNRPLLFSAALVLSTIGSSVAALSYLFTAIFYQQALPYIERLTNIQTPNLISRWYVLVIGLISLVSLVGIVKLWQYRKSGFFIYLAAQITLLVLPLLYIGKHAFSSTNTIFTLLFVLIYLSFLKILK